MVDKTIYNLHLEVQLLEIRIVDPISNNYEEDSLLIKVMEAVREGMGVEVDSNRVGFHGFNIYKIRM